jgi:hypothetical protein
VQSHQPGTSETGKVRDEMPRAAVPCHALTVGQLAKRWGVSADRVRQLVQSGRLPGAFTIPSAGRYGATVKIPLATITQAEEDWAVVPQPQAGSKPRRRRGDAGPALKHFPKLATNPEPASGSRADAQG